MIHPLLVPQRACGDIPPIVKHCVRFGRRLRAHRIDTTNFPSYISDDGGATIIVGSRIVHIDDDGSYTPQLKPVRVGLIWRFDRQAITAFRARSHARFLEIAASDRARGWRKSAINMLALAAHDRGMLVEFES